jgi:hypothetical protein
MTRSPHLISSIWFQDEAPDGSYQFWAGFLGYHCWREELLYLFKLGDQLVLVIGDDDSSSLTEPLRGRHLVVVAMFAQVRPFGHHDNGFSLFKSRDDRSRPSVGHNESRGAHAVAKFVWSQELDGFDVPRFVAGPPDLSKYVRSVPRSSPFIDRANQAIERVCAANRDEDQSTAPLK